MKRRAGRCLVESGDAVFVRVGLGAREAALGAGDPAVRAGLDPSCLSWLHRREVAVFCGDCVDQIASGYDRLAMPLHEIGFPRWACASSTILTWRPFGLPYRVLVPVNSCYVPLRCGSQAGPGHR
jgi:hypothetical protein